MKTLTIDGETYKKLVDAAQKLDDSTEHLTVIAIETYLLILQLPPERSKIILSALLLDSGGKEWSLN